MGYSYSNIQLKRGNREISAEEIAGILAEGLKLKKADSLAEADVITAVGPADGGQWITIVSDVFDQDIDKCCETATTLSEKYGTEVIAISCVDSDYLCLNLVDAPNRVDAWAACGRFPDGKAPRRSNLANWKGYVPDVDAMRQVMRSCYSFAEECLDDLEGMLSLPAEQGRCCTDQADPEKGYRCFYYTAKKSEAAEEPTVFKPSAFTGRSYGFQGVSNYVDFVNHSGASRGVGVFIGGPAIVSGQVRIESAWIQMKDRRGKRMRVPVELKETAFDNGVTGLYGTAPDIRIRETIPDGLPLRKATEMYYDRMITVRFEPVRACDEGTEPGFLQVTLIPLRNPAGQGSQMLAFLHIREHQQK